MVSLSQTFCADAREDELKRDSVVMNEKRVQPPPVNVKVQGRSHANVAAQGLSTEGQRQEERRELITDWFDQWDTSSAQTTSFICRSL